MLSPCCVTSQRSFKIFKEATSSQTVGVADKPSSSLEAVDPGYFT